MGELQREPPGRQERYRGSHQGDRRDIEGATREMGEVQRESPGRQERYRESHQGDGRATEGDRRAIGGPLGRQDSYRMSH